MGRLGSQTCNHII